MKNLRLSLILLFLLFAQGATYAAGLDFGLDFGLSGGNFKVKGDKSAIDNELGYGIGASMRADFGLVSVGPELWYSRNTMTLDGSYNNGEQVLIKSNSLDLPITVGFSFLKVLSVEAGPSFSLFNKAKAEVGGSEHDIGRLKPNMGYVVGAKITILKILVVGARFNGIFSTQDSSLGTSSLQAVRSNSYTISVGARF